MKKFCVVSLIQTCFSDSYNDYIDGSREASGNCVCPCDPRRDSYCRYRSGKCYQPICPIGTYLCCVFCRYSTCVRSSDLAESTRGVRECIICPPGHYCSGCDVPTRCPINTINPHVGLSKLSDCQPCQLGFSATRDATQCCYNGNMCSGDPEGWNYLSERTSGHLRALRVFYCIFMTSMFFM